MPANKAIICIDGREYDIELLQYQFVLPCNTIEKPHFFVKDGLLRFCIDSTDDNYILEKMLSTQNSAILQGSINVFGNDDDMPIRRISFEEGYVVYCREEMSLLYGENYMKTVVVISCQEMTIDKWLMIERYSGLGWIKKKENEVKPLESKIYAPPIPLVTKVTGKAKAFVSEKVTYQVTSYNLSSIEKDTRDRIQWIIKIGEKEEKLSQRGEKIELQMKKEWLGKEITLMPYLRKPDEKVSVNTRVDIRLSLFFNGNFLVFRVVEDGVIHRFTYKAVSGRPTENGSFDYSINRQKLKDIGPIPEGEYHINPQEIQYTANRSTIDKVKGVFGGGTFRGGETAWGIGRIWIKPQKITIDGIVRENFSIHGGETPGSAGCIDITSNDVHFFKQVTKYRRDCTKIQLIVKYK